MRLPFIRCHPFPPTNTPLPQHAPKQAKASLQYCAAFEAEAEEDAYDLLAAGDELDVDVDAAAADGVGGAGGRGTAELQRQRQHQQQQLGVAGAQRLSRSMQVCLVRRGQRGSSRQQADTHIPHASCQDHCSFHHCVLAG